MAKKRIPQKRGAKRNAAGTTGNNRAPEPAPRRAKPAAARESAWLFRCAPGLGRTVQGELRHRNLIRHTDRVDRLWQRNHDLLFVPRLRQDPTTVPALRLVEDASRCLIYGRYKISRQQLDRLAEALRTENTAWRLAVTVEGTHFNRQDLRRWLARELSARHLGIDDGAAATLFVFCIESAYYIGHAAYTAADAVGRDARTAERQGSLPPTVAAAMVFLGRPRDSDIILDPVCGSGTLLAEAHAAAPAARLIGRDIDRKAVAAARKNLDETASDIGPGDATALDLGSDRPSLVLANLPFGKQFGDAAETPDLYHAVFTELNRWRAPTGWRGVMLTHDAGLVRQTCPSGQMTVRNQIPIKIRGEAATIVTLES